MRLAVLLPIYNSERYLLECLNSIFSQTFTDFCVIAVNDASTDKSAEMLETYMRTEARLKVFHFDTNKGNPTAAQFAMEIANNMDIDYIARMDSDDICLPTRFEKQIAYLDQHKDIDVLGSNVVLLNQKDMTTSFTDVPLTDSEIKVNLMSARANILNPTVMWRKQIVKDLGIVHNVLPISCDYAMWVSLALHKRKFANLEDSLVIYRIHPQQVSNRTELREKSVTVTLTRYMKALFPEFNEQEILRFVHLFSFSRLELSLDDCKLTYQAYLNIKNREKSVLGENRIKLIKNLEKKLEPIKEFLDQHKV